MTAEALIIIPARMGAQRLPGKPLADIHGAPMVVRVARCAQAARAGRVVIAAAEPEIAAAAATFGVEAQLTDPALPSGSDRVFAAAQAIDPDGAIPIIVNLQGDMPNVAPDTISATLACLQRTPACDIATAVQVSEDEADRANPNVVKALLAGLPRAGAGQCLAFSRAAIPSGPGALWRHLGVYAFRRPALARFVAAPPSPIELRERLEQWRALELGLRIDAAIVDDWPISVDTPEDLARARAMIA